MVDLCHSLCTMPICIWLMWTRQRTRESHHPPVIMILALHCCVARKSACIRACVCVRICMCHASCMRVHPCVCLRATNKDSIWSEPLNVPVWNTSVILNSLFEATPRWSRARRRVARGPIWGVRSRREPPADTILSSAARRITLTKRDLVCDDPPLPLSPPWLSNSIRCDYMCNKESEDPSRLCW